MSEEFLFSLVPIVVEGFIAFKEKIVLINYNTKVSLSNCGTSHNIIYIAIILLKCEIYTNCGGDRIRPLHREKSAALMSDVTCCVSGKIYCERKKTEIVQEKHETNQVKI